jgi:hypothetical protein
VCSTKGRIPSTSKNILSSFIFLIKEGGFSKTKAIIYGSTEYRNNN